MTQKQQSEGFNAVVVGSGGIASALAQQLLEDPTLASLYLLERSPADLGSEARVKRLTIEATDKSSINAAAEVVAAQVERVHLLINTVGVLHNDRLQPEKRLTDLQTDNLLESMTVNALVTPMLAQAFSGLLKHDEAATLAALSARVGSIADNSMGGWYSYRASKAAHNMLLKTLANEWRLSHRNVSVLALHPGTVATSLSQPFIRPGYKNPVLEPTASARALLDVIAGVPAGQSGLFLDWKGQTIDW